MEADELLQTLLDALDEGLFQTLYKRASVDPSEVYSALSRAGHPVQSLADVRDLPVAVIDPVVDQFIREARRLQALSGASLGAGGWLGLAPGLMHMAVTLLRLAQRVGLAYGFDPRDSADELELWKALATAVGAKVDWEGTDAELYRRLPLAVTGTSSFSNPILVRALHAILLRLAAATGLRVTRWIPLVGSGTGLILNYLEVDRVGRRLKTAYRSRHAIEVFDRSEGLEVEILS